ncbi:MAG: TonB-dependent receptor [Calditrichia bacterium]|nr:TonB-dependent receptor [Calditrichia bacterium]
MRVSKIFIILILTLQITIAANNGRIKGILVEYTTKQPLVGANVIISGTIYGDVTDNNGKYFIKDVPEDIYKLEIQYIGYASHFETDVRVIRNKTTYVKEIALVPSMIKGEVIEVIAEAFEENDQAPVSNFSYSREEIKRSPGAAGDIFRAIETLPGVSSSGGEFSAFSVRGGSPTENIVLVDNIPFSKVSHFVGGSQDEEIQGGRFSIFTPGLIEEADFQAGGFPARFGGKNASIINLKIKEGNKEDYTFDSRYDFLGWEVNYNGPTYILDNTSLVVSARGQDFKTIFEMTDNEDGGHPRFADYIVKSTSNINAKHKVSVLGIYSTENMDRNIDHVFLGSSFDDDHLIDQEEQKYLLGTNWRYLTGKKSYLQTSIYYEKTHTNAKIGRAYPDYVNGIAPSEKNCRVRENIYDIDFIREQLGLKSDFTYQFSKNMMSTSGIEINRYTDELDYLQNGIDTVYIFDQNDYRPNPEQKYLISNPDYYTRYLNESKILYSAFSEFSITLDDRFIITPGLRYEFDDYNEEHYIAPRFSARYVINPKTSLNFATGIYYQRPDFRIIGGDDRNHNLSNEKAIHYILGLSRNLSNTLKITLETYYKTFDDLIVKPDRTSNYALNTGDGWASGIDISLIRRFVDKFYGQINYSYAVSKRNDNNRLSEYNSDFNQPHIFNILAGYQLNKEWSFSAKWKYATGRPTDSYIVYGNIFNDPDFIRYSQEITGKNNRRFEDFHTMNIRVDYRKQLKSRIALVAYLDILNAYGHENFNSERFLERTGEVKFEGFTMMPSFGVKLEL